MTRNQLVRRVAKLTNSYINHTDLIVRTTFDVIADVLAEYGKVEIPSFGTFDTMERKGRVYINPQTNTKVRIPDRKYPVLKTSPKLRDMLK